MSPILVRPVREQLEHDRVIRLLLVRLQRRGEVVANIGDSQTVPIRVGPVLVFPDLVVTTADKGHRILETVEVETAESVNHLEAMAQWAHLGRGRAPFHLYVPAGSVEIARRLAAENQVNIAELWSFHTMGDQTRFTMVHRSPAEFKRAAAELKRTALQGEKAASDSAETAGEAPSAGDERRSVDDEPVAAPAAAPARPKSKTAAATKKAPSTAKSKSAKPTAGKTSRAQKGR